MNNCTSCVYFKWFAINPKGTVGYCTNENSNFYRNVVGTSIHCKFLSVEKNTRREEGEIKP